MSQQAVAEYFQALGRDDLQIVEFTESSATVNLAAQALGVEPRLIAKTLAYRLKDRDIIIVACGTARVSNRKFKDTFRCKATMLSAEDTLESTGHPVGGVCPFGLKNPLDVYLDESLRKFTYVYPAAGQPNNAVKIRVAEFASLVNGDWVDVCEEYREE